MNSFRLAILIIGLAVVGSSQTIDSFPIDCLRVESESRDFSACVPSKEYLVESEGKYRRILYESRDLSLSLIMTAGKGAKERFSEMLQFSGSSKGQTFTSGDFLILQSTPDTSDVSDGAARFLDFASSKGSYSMSVKVRRRAVAYLDRFLISILLNGKPMFTAKADALPESGRVDVLTLETSREITAALTKPDSREKKLVRTKTDDVEGSADDKNDFSRRLVILRNPRAGFSDAARSARASGTVRLLVTFLADGTIGPIKLIESIHPDLDKNSFEAARKIKFLPAEVAGRPVDFSRIMKYSFTVY